jgi:formiminotetrahydrofolate cyclodeaminase
VRHEHWRHSLDDDPRVVPCAIIQKTLAFCVEVGDQVFVEHPVREFLDELASGDPVPGGGSAAALAGALAAGLVSMVCNLTIGRRRFREAEPVLRRTLDQAEQHRSRLTALVQEDTEVYARVMAAYRLPAGTDMERQQRDLAWQAALADAAAGPMEIAEQCLEVLRLALMAGQLGNPWAISDAGAAALLAEAAGRAAGLSVEVNLRSMTDMPLAESYRRRLGACEQQGAVLCQEVLDSVQSRMGA